MFYRTTPVGAIANVCQGGGEDIHFALVSGLAGFPGDVRKANFG
jgi:hypothetical protein